MTGKNIVRRSLADRNRPKGIIRDDAPDSEDLGADFWDNAQIVEAQPKDVVSLRLDAETLAFFKKDGDGHTRRMSEVLRAYAKAKAS